LTLPSTPTIGVTTTQTVKYREEKAGLGLENYAIISDG
jgi:hypothetical protein